MDAPDHEFNLATTVDGKQILAKHITIDKGIIIKEPVEDKHRSGGYKSFEISKVDTRSNVIIDGQVASIRESTHGSFVVIFKDPSGTAKI